MRPLASNLTFADITETLADISRDIEKAAHAAAAADLEATKRRVAYKGAHARAFLTADGAMDIRRETAMLTTQDELLAYELAQAEHRAAVEQIRVLRDRLEVGRSIGALIRAEYSQS